ncbi:non-ribosomal peptide synthetase, partial [Streptomyces lavendulae]|uniref:non-ribosomal peptide synthetase n=1 Tax=Streptomyces lavendulae TaxID=1914 RepID=UPI002553AD19
MPGKADAGRLLRLTIARLNPHHHLITINIHHIAADGWSTAILATEIQELYAAATENRPPNLPELTVQYADYAIWQRQWLQNHTLNTQLDYWRTTLAGLEPLELPTDHPRPTHRTGHGNTIDFTIPTETTSALRQLAQREGATLFMTLAAVFQVMLSKYTAQHDIAIGIPIAGRNRTEIEDLIGFFVNTLVLRSNTSNDPTFQDFLHQVKTTTLNAYEHQDLPFERLVDELAPERDLSRTPLFQVMLALQNTTHTTWHLTNTDITPLPLHTTTEKFDLLMSVEERSHDLRVQLSYSTDLFGLATIERMAGHFQTLLAHAATTPTTPLSRLPMLTPAEEHQLLIEWNGPRTEFSEDSCIHELVEERAETLPDKLAVVDGDTRLTYRELNTRANQLAHHLRDMGVGPEVLVGICAERSAELITALLAVLKAGGVYVPLDPDYPASRLEFMQQDTATPVVIVQSHLRDRIRLLHSRIVDLGHDRELFSAQPMSNPVPSTNPNNLAYVIYTSGSTGIPKGVQIRHRGIVSLFQPARDAGLLGGQGLYATTKLLVDGFSTKITRVCQELRVL